MLMMVQSTSTNNGVMQDQVNTINQLINQKTVQKIQIKKEVTELEKKSVSASLAVTNLNDSLNAIVQSQEIINGDLLLSLSKLSGTINLESIKETADGLQISGFAPTSSDIEIYARTILTYARDLEISERFSESTISSMSLVMPSGPPGSSIAKSDTTQQIEFTLTFAREK
jgi:chromosome segregation ATPase